MTGDDPSPTTQREEIDVRVPGGWRTGAAGALAVVTVAAVVLAVTGHQSDGTQLSPQASESTLPLGPAPVAAGPVLPGVDESAPAPTVAGMSRALNGLMQQAVLGPHVGGVVLDAATGAIYYGSQAAGTFAPASATKLFTATAALSVLGADRRLETKVVSGSAGEIVLVGGGDPTLSLTAPAGFVPAPASLPALAAATARALKAAGRTTVRLDYDTTLFTGPRTAPTWPADYVSSGIVSPITALTVDEGRTGPIVEGSAPRVDDPPATAAADFGRLLAKQGITLSGTSRSVTSSAGATKVAAVFSPPLADLVQWMLTTSDNDLAEALAHLTGGAGGAGASFASGVTAVRAAVGALGIPLSSVELFDGSGLTPSTAAPPSVLGQILVTAASSDHPQLRPVLTGLPVSAFTGSLQDRFLAPGTQPVAGMVRAKTGTLTGVSALAGLVDDAAGRVLVFVFLADQVPSGGTVAARGALDKLAAAVGSCGCGA
jgi:D-alanyl-D-alanine carboxypeptidase/D-alanyl-D-alanine-endopeptidase (penicillin-binding protein 4)